MSELWLLPLAVGGAGALALAVLIHKLNDAVSELHRSMRPLRVRRTTRP